MNWKNLSRNNCPKCGELLNNVSNGKECSECDFFITSNKLNDLSDTFSRDDFKSEMEGYGF